MKIGIMGGTLDPVHNGHLAIADAVRRECGLDSVMLLPAGDPPHKKRQIDKYDRLAMAKLAAEGVDWLFVSELEVLREGTTYTVDTLSRLCSDHPDTQWVYIIGADTLKVLHCWKNFDKVAGLCTFAVAGRPGEDGTEMRRCAAELEERFGAEIRILNICGPEISSTCIRDAVAKGKSISEMVPLGVEAYIREKGLYLCSYSWNEMDAMLRTRLKPGRYEHTLGVVDTAVRLSARYGVDPQRARLAALLHDCAKPMPYGELLKLTDGLADVDDEEREMEPVLHAPAGAVIARRDFGVQDPEVLSAIRCHTLGRPEMTCLEMLIFVADFIEPGRKPFDGLDTARELAERDLAAAAKMCAELSGRFVVSQGGRIHPKTAAFLSGNCGC